MTTHLFSCLVWHLLASPDLERSAASTMLPQSILLSAVAAFIAHRSYPTHVSLTVRAATSDGDTTCAGIISCNAGAKSSRRSVLTTFGSAALLAVSSPQQSYAKTTAAATVSVSSGDLQRIYDEGASTYDDLYSNSLVSKTLDFPTLRSNILSKATGDVLELGVGTGLNLQYYGGIDESLMNSYTALDISPKMMERAQAKFANGVPSVASSLNKLNRQGKVEFRIGDVNNLSDIFGGGRKFDTIIDTFGLCVFPDPLTALTQARECLKPGGKVLLLEHQDSVLGKVLNPTRNIADVIGTCRYDDDVLELLKSVGFRDVSYKSYAGGFLLEIDAS